MVLEEIEEVKLKKVEVETCIQDLGKDVGSYYDRAKSESNMSILAKANAIRKSIKLKKKLVNDLDVALEKLLEEDKKSI